MSESQTVKKYKDTGNKQKPTHSESPVCEKVGETSHTDEEPPHKNHVCFCHLAFVFVKKGGGPVGPLYVKREGESFSIFGFALMPCQARPHPLSGLV